MDNQDGCCTCTELREDLASLTKVVDALRADSELAWKYDQTRVRLIGWVEHLQKIYQPDPVIKSTVENSLAALNGCYFDVPHARAKITAIVEVACKAIALCQARYGAHYQVPSEKLRDRLIMLTGTPRWK